ncbi:NAD(P)/FAD-dependent oxidoreductase [Methylomonas montana]|uniref:NAD(P)/FAD-dependent oxidoreductase n=1 Tax=Methylomonas montana TaxID=3058963 RepID=UPI002658FACC|nr:NAD(P)/FAD-dependent oxidoreductase [Methylomonas montana]WKJ92571.1 NAD(P)/FAD-dependent oxidoreductase [Methylomonas montana]
MMPDNKQNVFDYDVVVVGGGPAGSTAATLLAQYGHKILLLESDRHPRFHIGESMLPFSEPVIQRLGIDWSAGNLAKSGAVFIDETTEQRMYFPLSVHRKTYQIERGPFDQLLFENAAKHGVETHQEEKVLDVSCQPQGVDIVSDKGQYRCRYLIDATGRSALTGRKGKAIQRIENLGKFAVYSHFQNIQPGEEADDLFRSGNIYVPVVDIGWIWVIPLSGRRLSVGLVVQKDRPRDCDAEALLRRYLAASPILNRLLAGAEQSAPVRVEADFSYTNQSRYGSRYACCGDAAGFLDPVFSSGVFLAFTSAARVADRVHQGLAEGREADPELHAEDDQNYLLGFNTMRLFVERFYQSNIVHNLFFEADRDPDLKAQIAQLLAGDLWVDNNTLQQSLLAGRRNVS